MNFLNNCLIKIFITAKDAPLSKSDLESMRRSIDYRIKEEAKITRTLFTASSSYVDVEKILLGQTMTDLPKIDLSSLHILMMH